MLIAINKPYGILSQFTPEPGSDWRTLADFKIPPGLYPIGRLDADSEGLLLLSDEKPLVDRLLNPRNAHSRVYWVQVEKIPDAKAIDLLKQGVRIGDYQTRPCEAKLLTPQPAVEPRTPPIRIRKTVPDSWLSISLIEGKNRQVRRMTAAVGHPTLRLIRTKIGDLTLEQLNLAAGQWRELSLAERQQALKD